LVLQAGLLVTLLVGMRPLPIGLAYSSIKSVKARREFALARRARSPVHRSYSPSSTTNSVAASAFSQ